ncbi:MAG: hypothetical protein N3B12_04805 [Armatimonadetes bacterium]|nr:hypothetical protein [Armatimonadota bacterium]
MGDRRLAGCAVRFLAAFVLCCVFLAVVTRRTSDPGFRLSAALGMTGLLFGFVASALTTRAAKLLTRVFVLLPLAVASVLFAYRTLFDRVDELPLRLVLAPLALALGFMVGRGRRISS